MPQEDSIFVWLSTDGNISSVNLVPSEDVQNIRKWEGVGSNGTSFPAFSVLPLLRVTEDADCKKISAMKRSQEILLEEISNISATAENLWDDKLGKKTNTFDKVKTCLDKPVKDMITRLSNAPEEYSSVSLLLDSASKIVPLLFYEQLKNELICSPHARG